MSETTAIAQVTPYWLDERSLAAMSAAFAKLQNAGMAPQGMTPAAGMIVAWVARVQYGIDDPFVAWNSGLYVVKGRLSQEGRMMLKRVEDAGHLVTFPGNPGPNDPVTAVGHRLMRDGSLREIATVTWGPEEDRIAGLAGSQTHKSFPRAMYRWRAVAELCRAAFSDIIGAFKYTPEEAEAIPSKGARVLEVTVDGETTTVQVDEADGPLAAISQVAAPEAPPVVPLLALGTSVDDAVEIATGAGADQVVIDMAAAAAWSKLEIANNGLPTGTTAFESPGQAETWRMRFVQSINRWHRDKPAGEAPLPDGVEEGDFNAAQTPALDDDNPFRGDS